MKRINLHQKYSKKSIWRLALLAIISAIWLIIRTGTKPSRVAYPCQKAAIMNIDIFLTALGLSFAGLTSKLLPERILRSRITTAGIVTSLLAIMTVSTIGMFTINAAPTINSTPVVLDLQSQTANAQFASNLFIVQNASGLEGNMDDAMSALLVSMQNHGLNLFKTSDVPLGLIGHDDVIIIKVNGQSPQRGGTNTDLAKSLVKAIVNHPDGFTGEIVIADNGQGSGGIDMTESNAYDHSQSMTDVAGMFPDYRVSAYSWYTIAENSVAEYENGNYQDGYIVNYTPNPLTGIRVSYPKFQTIYGTYISFKKGVWNTRTETYDSSRLKVINLPLFKSHFNYGATACIKNYMGVGSQTLTGMHDSVGNGGMGTEMVETRFPTLNILDCVWINANPFQPGSSYDSACGPFTTYNAASYANLIGASLDPVALEYWIAKHVAMPAAIQRDYSYTSSIDPDYEPITQNLVQSYHHYLSASMNQIRTKGYQVTMLENEMNVYVTTLGQSEPSPLQNLLQNGDFENGVSPWYMMIYDPNYAGYNGALTTTLGGYSGGYRGSITVNGYPIGNTGYISVEQEFSTKFDEVYALEFYYRSYDKMIVYPNVYAFDANWRLIQKFNSPACTSTNDWTFISTIFGPIPQGTVHVQLHFDIMSTGSFKIDNCVIKPTTPKRNLLQNGGFEADINPWYMMIYDPNNAEYAGTLLTSSDAYSGSHSGLITITNYAVNNGYISVEQEFPVTISQTYALEFCYKSTMTVYPNMYAFNSDWQIVEKFNGPTCILATDWTFITMTFGPVPQGTTHMQLHFDIVTEGTLQFDNTIIKETG